MDEDGEIRDKFSHISSGMNEAAEKSNRENKGVADVISSNMSIVGSNSSHEGGLVDKRVAGEIEDTFSHISSGMNEAAEKSNRENNRVASVISSNMSSVGSNSSPEGGLVDKREAGEIGDKFSNISSGMNEVAEKDSLEDKSVDEEGEIRDKFSFISSVMNEAAEKSIREIKGVTDVISSNMSSVGSNSSHEGGLVDKREAGEIGDKFSHEG